MILGDYKTIGELLAILAKHCTDEEVQIVCQSMSRCPRDWIASLSRKERNARIERISGGGGKPDQITVRIPGLFGSKRATYEIVWSPNREGWACPLGGRTVHYFIPKHRMADPPYCGDGMLVSLCKRNFFDNLSPFFPVDPKYSICKTCTKRIQEAEQVHAADAPPAP